MEALIEEERQQIKLEKRRQLKIARNISAPCSLQEALRAVPKTQLDLMRRLFNISGLSQLKKAELADELSKRIPSELIDRFFLLNEENYKLLRKLSRNEFIAAAELSLEKLAFLSDFSIAFPAFRKAKAELVITMPEEVRHVFQQAEKNNLQATVKRNTDYLNVTAGMLYYYGYLPNDTLYDMMTGMYGETFDMIEYMDILFFNIAEMDMPFIPADDGWLHCRVFGSEHLKEEQAMYPEVDYYPFTKEQFLQAADDQFVEYTPAMKKLLAFLQEGYHLSNEDLHEEALDFDTRIKNDISWDELITSAKEEFELPTAPIGELFTNHLMDVFMNTRQWKFKGYTQNEVNRLSTPEEHNVIDMQSYRKVRRNAPCPCGSGKKYKKCCGRK
ncbi:YecA family protein [Halalkalibacter oceani]|uniref:YecA family protein n=1 Tax=Halalkalibacter oceani TaxID=1653776 RepID=UPI0033912584